MSDLSVNGNSNVLSNQGQSVKKDSYEQLKKEYNDFIKKFGKEFQGKPSLYESQLTLLKKLQSAALAEGKTKEASDLEVKIILAELDAPKPKPQPTQQVNAQQVLAMQQGIKIKTPVPDLDRNAPVPTEPESGKSEEYFEGLDEEPQEINVSNETETVVLNNENNEIFLPEESDFKHDIAEEAEAVSNADIAEAVGTDFMQAGSNGANVDRTGTFMINDRDSMPVDNNGEVGSQYDIAEEGGIFSDEEIAILKKHGIKTAATVRGVEEKKDISAAENEILEKLEAKGFSHEEQMEIVKSVSKLKDTCFEPETALKIVSALIPEDTHKTAQVLKNEITGVSNLRKIITGESNKKSDFRYICTSDSRSEIAKSKKDEDTVSKQFIGSVLSQFSEIRGYDIEISKNSGEQSSKATDEVEKNEDEIVLSFVGKYKQADGSLNSDALAVIKGLRNNAYIPDKDLLPFTEACMKEDGSKDTDKYNAIVGLKEAGALTNEVLPILDLIPRGENGEYDQGSLDDAVDLTKGVISMPELGELLPQVKDKPGVKASIVAVSPYYPHQKAQLQELIPLMLDSEGNEDKNAAVIVRNMAEYMFPESQKWYAEIPKDMSIQSENIESVKIATEIVIEASKDDGSDVVNPVAIGLISNMAENSRDCNEIAEMLNICKDNAGKINENFAGIVGNLEAIDVKPKDIMRCLEEFMYRDGSIDDEKAKEYLDVLEEKTGEIKKAKEKRAQLLQAFQEQTE